MCKNHGQNDHEAHAANNMSAFGIILMAVILVMVIWNEFSNHHAMERIQSLSEDTGLHLAE